MLLSDWPNAVAHVDVLNKKYGNHTVLMSAALAAIKHKKRSRLRLPVFEAN
jgi:hypothetical protein